MLEDIEQQDDIKATTGEGRCQIHRFDVTADDFGAMMPRFGGGDRIEFDPDDMTASPGQLTGDRSVRRADVENAAAWRYEQHTNGVSVIEVRGIDVAGVS